jgi:hypothetical protein
VISPFALIGGQSGSLNWSDVICGILVIIFAIASAAATPTRWRASRFRPRLNP